MCGGSDQDQRLEEGRNETALYGEGRGIRRGFAGEGQGVLPAGVGDVGGGGAEVFCLLGFCGAVFGARGHRAPFPGHMGNPELRVIRQATAGSGASPISIPDG